MRLYLQLVFSIIFKKEIYILFLVAKRMVMAVASMTPWLLLIWNTLQHVKDVLIVFFYGKKKLTHKLWVCEQR
jgi:hypothetical protein